MGSRRKTIHAESSLIRVPITTEHCWASVRSFPPEMRNSARFDSKIGSGSPCLRGSDLGHCPSQLENPVAVRSNIVGTFVDVREETIKGMRHADRAPTNA